MNIEAQVQLNPRRIDGDGLERDGAKAASRDSKRRQDSCDCVGTVQTGMDGSSHKGGVFQITAEDGVTDVDDNGLGRLGVLRKAVRDYQKPGLQTKQGTRATYDNARHMNV